MKENIKGTNFDPNEYIISGQSTKIGTHENKAIHSTCICLIYCYDILPLLNLKQYHIYM